MKEVHENKNAVIQFKDVVRTYGEGEAVQYAVNHVDFTIYEGEFAVILGQSGAGKSTVLNMLGGIGFPGGENRIYFSVLQPDSKSYGI